jgi:hypothetical protein
MRMNAMVPPLTLAPAPRTPAPTPPAEPHPLDAFVSLDLNPKPPEWLIDQLIQVGVVTIAGMRGVGKTTSLLPLAAAVAHLCPPDYPLRPTLRRHVIWITEDRGQVERSLAALIRHAKWCTEDDVKAWIHVVDAKRLPAEMIAKVAPLYAARYSRQHVGRRRTVDVKPLVVFDTSNACFELKDECDNAEVGRHLGMLKTAFAGFPIMIVHHLAKNLGKADDPDSLSARGAGAWEADAHQCLYLVKSRSIPGQEERLMLLGKRRFETQTECLRFESHVDEIVVETADGEERLPLRYNLPQRVIVGQREIQREIDALSAQASRRSQVLQIAKEAQAKGEPVSKSQLRALMKGNARAAGTLIDTLLAESWLITVNVPSHLRVNPARSAFLVALEADEREAYLANGDLPAEKVRIPASYRKSSGKATE